MREEIRVLIAKLADSGAPQDAIQWAALRPYEDIQGAGGLYYLARNDLVAQLLEEVERAGHGPLGLGEQRQAVRTLGGAIARGPYSNDMDVEVFHWLWRVHPFAADRAVAALEDSAKEPANRRLEHSWAAWLKRMLGYDVWDDGPDLDDLRHHLLFLAGPFTAASLPWSAETLAQAKDDFAERGLDPVLVVWKEEGLIGAVDPCDREDVVDVFWNHVLACLVRWAVDRSKDLERAREFVDKTAGTATAVVGSEVFRVQRDIDHVAGDLAVVQALRALALPRLPWPLDRLQQLAETAAGGWPPDPSGTGRPLPAGGRLDALRAAADLFTGDRRRIYGEQDGDGD